jgi:hypothetical protein
MVVSGENRQIPREPIGPSGLYYTGATHAIGK